MVSSTEKLLYQKKIAALQARKEMTGEDTRKLLSGIETASREKYSLFTFLIRKIGSAKVIGSRYKTKKAVLYAHN